MITKIIFSGIVAAIFCQRLWEQKISQANTQELLEKGAREHGSNALPIVKTLQISWFILMLVEVWWLNRPFVPIVSFFAAITVITGQYLRYLSMQSLGDRWTLPIITLPDKPPVTKGVYQYMRHPNWLGVILEIAALPMIHGACLTALVFSVANFLLIDKRVQAEEKALNQDNNYEDLFGERSRFIPIEF